MSYQLPSLRARRGVALILQPAPAPETVAAERQAICDVCPDNAQGNCRLFACCQKSIATTVRLALRACPAGRWGIFKPESPGHCFCPISPVAVSRLN